MHLSCNIDDEMHTVGTEKGVTVFYSTWLYIYIASRCILTTPPYSGRRIYVPAARRPGLQQRKNTVLVLIIDYLATNGSFPRIPAIPHERQFDVPCGKERTAGRAKEVSTALTAILSKAMFSLLLFDSSCIFQ
jgi:hypothetical protein